MLIFTDYVNGVNYLMMTFALNILCTVCSKSNISYVLFIPNCCIINLISCGDENSIDIFSVSFMISGGKPRCRNYSAK